MAPPRIRSAWVSLAALLAPLWLDAQDPATIRGIVVQAGTGEPVFGADVLVRSTPLWVSSGEDGSFEITLPGGVAYTLVVVAGGFRTVERTIEPGEAGDEPFRFSAGAAPLRGAGPDRHGEPRGRIRATPPRASP